MKKPDVVSFLKLSFDLLLNGYSLPLADHAIQSVTQERQQGNFLKDCQNSAAMKSSPPPPLDSLRYSTLGIKEMSCTWSFWPTFCRFLMHILISEGLLIATFTYILLICGNCFSIKKTPVPPTLKMPLIKKIIDFSWGINWLSPEWEK